MQELPYGATFACNWSRAIAILEKVQPDEETLYGMLEMPNQPTYPNSIEEINRMFQLNLGMLANSEDKDHQL